MSTTRPSLLSYFSSYDMKKQRKSGSGGYGEARYPMLPDDADRVFGPVQTRPARQTSQFLKRNFTPIAVELLALFTSIFSVALIIIVDPQLGTFHWMFAIEVLILIECLGVLAAIWFAHAVYTKPVSKYRSDPGFVDMFWIETVFWYFIELSSTVVSRQRFQSKLSLYELMAAAFTNTDETMSWLRSSFSQRFLMQSFANEAEPPSAEAQRARAERMEKTISSMEEWEKRLMTPWKDRGPNLAILRNVHVARHACSTFYEHRCRIGRIGRWFALYLVVHRASWIRLLSLASLRSFAVSHGHSADVAQAIQVLSVLTIAQGVSSLILDLLLILHTALMVSVVASSQKVCKPATTVPGALDGYHQLHGVIIPAFCGSLGLSPAFSHLSTARVDEPTIESMRPSSQTVPPPTATRLRTRSSSNPEDPDYSEDSGLAISAAHFFPQVVATPSDPSSRPSPARRLTATAGFPSTRAMQLGMIPDADPRLDASRVHWLYDRIFSTALFHEFGTSPVHYGAAMPSATNFQVCSFMRFVDSLEPMYYDDFSIVNADLRVIWVLEALSGMWSLVWGEDAVEMRVVVSHVINRRLISIIDSMEWDPVNFAPPSPEALHHALLHPV
eukprot:ANDGO_08103.mRNA.1 hypothetical protein